MYKHAYVCTHRLRYIFTDKSNSTVYGRGRGGRGWGQVLHMEMVEGVPISREGLVEEFFFKGHTTLINTYILRIQTKAALKYD